MEQNGKLKRYRNREDEILFMDLRQMGSPYEKKYIELTEEDRAKVTSVSVSYTHLDVYKRQDLRKKAGKIFVHRRNCSVVDMLRILWRVSS